LRWRWRRDAFGSHGWQHFVLIRIGLTRALVAPRRMKVAVGAARRRAFAAALAVRLVVIGWDRTGALLHDGLPRAGGLHGRCSKRHSRACPLPVMGITHFAR